MLNHMYRAKEKKMAYLLHTEFGYTKQAIAQLMGISPQQMGVWIKEVGYELKIYQIQYELDQIREELHRLGYSPQKELNQDVMEIIHSS